MKGKAPHSPHITDLDPEQLASNLQELTDKHEKAVALLDTLNKEVVERQRKVADRYAVC